MTTGALRFGSDAEPGIRRSGRARVRYVDERTGRPPDDATLERIRRLAVPPAWTDVWISPHPDSHLQATGRDAKGRKQYRYHADFVATRADHKFSELVSFGTALPILRRRVRQDLAATTPSHDHVVAVVVRLLDLTGLRIGNEEYVRANRSYGLTTLKNGHALVRGSSVRLTFRGKSAHSFDVRVEDPRLAKLVRRCQHLPGQRLFEYVSEAGEVRPVGSSDVNDYLRGVTGNGTTAKTFRTWNATVDAAARLAERSRVEDAPTVAGLNEVIDEVAATIGNTRAVCRSSYIHPAVIDRYRDATLLDSWDRPPSAHPRVISDAEHRLLRLLRGERRRASARR